MHNWATWLSRNAGQIGSDDYGYELLFARQVLPRVPELDPEDVTPQLEVLLDGRVRRIDFAVRRNDTKLAIEIDGWDKSGTGIGMTREQHQDFLARQNALVLAGWTVVRFTPVEVRDQPAQVAKRLGEALAKTTRGVPSREIPSSLMSASVAPITVQSPLVQAPSTSPVPPAPVKTSSAGAGVGGAVAAAVILGIVSVVGVFAVAGRAGDTVSCSSYGVVRGNVNQSGEHIYHMPSDAYYDATNPEQCFATPADAEDAGYRRSKI